jgi:predicted RNase H-like HicB family nuclease
MKQEYTAVIKKAEGWWIGWIEEVPGVNCQERTRTALLESLREILAEALDLNRNEALAAAGAGYREAKIAL